MFYLSNFIFLVLCTVGVSSESLKANDSWTGKWFPQEPYMRKSDQNDLIELFDNKKAYKVPNETWEGKWFPSVPQSEFVVSQKDLSSVEEHCTHCSSCDDGKTNIGIDFNPVDSRHSYNYLCLDHELKYEPSFSTIPIQREYTVPPAYEAPSYCLNETIKYEYRLPTFGAHRYTYSKYGEYKFLPPQRWLHNLEFGAIVMLFHPCADKMQVEKLRNTLSACLYRHIITPSTLLLPERPLALLAWSKSLEMSAVYVSTVVNFIKENAKKGPKQNHNVYQGYDTELLIEAKLVTDEHDNELCANIVSS